MFKLTLISLLVVQISCENCAISTLTAVIFDTIDSEAEYLSVSDKIDIRNDAFHLLIDNQTLPRLCEGSVQISNELSVLQIRNSNLLSIDPGAFRIIPTLALLKISYNALTTLKAGVFNDVKVKELDLSHNFISTIENDAFDNNSRLEILWLNYNAIKELNPVWFGNSPNVYKLNVIYNELTKIPSRAFQNMAKKRALNLRLSANRISHIEDDAFDGCGDIAVLRLNGNKLQELPSGLFINKTLKHLEINTNRLLCFPDLLYQSSVRSLQFLDNSAFKCACLNKVRSFVNMNNVDVLYPAIICEDRAREVNIVYNFNKTYEIPLLAMPSPEESLLIVSTEESLRSK